jgi:hypothetical protein
MSLAVEDCCDGDFVAAEVLRDILKAEIQALLCGKEGGCECGAGFKALWGLLTTYMKGGDAERECTSQDSDMLVQSIERGRVLRCCLLRSWGWISCTSQRAGSAGVPAQFYIFIPCGVENNVGGGSDAYIIQRPGSYPYGYD